MHARVCMCVCVCVCVCVLFLLLFHDTTPNSKTCVYTKFAFKSPVLKNTEEKPLYKNSNYLLQESICQKEFDMRFLLHA